MTKESGETPSESLTNALEVLHNCVYLIGTGSDPSSKQMARWMSSALDVVTTFVVEKVNRGI
jgi:hypothetical protein